MFRTPGAILTPKYQNIIVKKLIKKSLKLKYDNLEVKPDLCHEALNNSTYLYGSKGWIVGV